MDEESCRKRHDALLKLVDRRKQQRAIGLPTDKGQPPYIAISDDYLNLVLGGQIEVVREQRLIKATLDEGSDDANSAKGSSLLRLELSSGNVVKTAHRIKETKETKC